MIASTRFLFVTVFTVVSKNGLEKTVKTVVWRPTLRNKTYTSVFLDMVMLDTFFVRIFSECRLTFEFIFYKTVVLNVELYLRRKIEKRNLRKISINTERTCFGKMKILVVIILVLTANYCINVDELFKQIVSKEHLFIKKTNRALTLLSHIDFWNGKKKRNLVEKVRKMFT